MSKKINFIFWGTPDVASKTLEILKQNGFLPSLIITSPDKPQGRKMIITPPPTKTWAIANNIPYLQPEKLDELKSNLPLLQKSDISIVVAYGKIMPEEIINAPKLGSINIHYSLLPKYRGASPVESAILNGDKQTGISIQKMEYKMDAGPIITEEKVPIHSLEKAFELRERLIKIGGELLVKTLPNIIDEKIKSTPQDETKATYTKKIKKEDGLINLSDDPIKNFNKFKAYYVWPRTFFINESKRIIITDATIENTLFIIKRVLPEGKKEVDYSIFISSQKK